MKQHIILVLLCLLFHVPGMATLPPIDRDEARFAQATAQMLESGDFIRISFQDEARNKKPVGIYWLQAAAVAISGTLESRVIWPYRLPSLLGAIAAVLLTFSMGKRLFDHKTAFLGAALLAASTLLVIEAHLATTDAFMLATVVAAQGALSRYYVRSDNDDPPGTAAFLTFWCAQAVGILIKGPLTPLISVLTILCLIAADREAGWLKGLRPFRGIMIVALIVSPWLIAITLATKGAFFQESVGRDLLSKVGSAQELHGFPPGFYLLLLPITLWPASFFIGPAVWRAWKSRSGLAIRFCLAWIVPVWIMFELIPTKLPHYVLPTYPALCLLIAGSLWACSAGGAAEVRSRLVRIGSIACGLAIWVAGAGICAIPSLMDRSFHAAHMLPVLASAVLTAIFIREILGFRYARAAVVAVIGTFIVFAPAFQWIIPGANGLWLSRSAADEAHGFMPDGSPFPVASTGYYEPSLVFLLGTQTSLTSSSRAALFLSDHPTGLVFVAGKEDEEFRRVARGLRVPVTLLATIQGFNYTLGKDMTLRLYGRNAGRSTAAPRAKTDSRPPESRSP